MKRLFVSLITLALAVNCVFAQRTISDLAGRWESSDGNNGSVEFVEGSKVVVSINGMQVPSAAYTIDFSKSPIWFDVFVAAGKTVKGLLEFEDDDTIKWQIFLSGDRSYDFTESDANPIMILKRKK
jgi:hypothetical protein